MDWTSATRSEGFVVSHAIISDQDGHTLLDVPDIAALGIIVRRIGRDIRGQQDEICVTAAA